MPLQKQLVPITYGGGLDTKSDPSSVPLGKWLILENCTFIKPNSLHKRNGYSSLTQSILGGGSIAAGAALMGKGNELLLADGTSLYSYDQPNSAWANKGAAPSLSWSLINGIDSQYSLQGYDVAYHSNGLACVVAERLTLDGTYQGVLYSVVDTTTGQLVVQPTLLDATTDHSPKVCVLGNFFMIFWLNGVAPVTLKAQAINVTAPQSLVYGSPQAVTSGTTTNAVINAFASATYDLTSFNNQVYVAFPNNSGTTTIFGITAASPYAQPNSAVVAGVASLLVCLCGNLFNNDVVIGYVTSGDTFGAAAYNSNLTTQTKAPTTLDTQALGTYDSIAAVSTSASATAIQFYATGGQGAPNACFLRQNTFGSGYSVGTASTLVRSVILAGKPVLLSGKVYIPAWFTVRATQNLQSTWFLLDSTGRAVAKAYPGTAAGYEAYNESWSLHSRSRTMLPETPFVSSTQLLLAIGNSLRRLGTSWASLATQQFGINLLTLDFNDTANNYTRALAGNELFTSGALPQMYDGGTVTEHGFLQYPQNVTSAIGAGTIPAGTYQYIVVYEWQDSSGQIHRSTPSVALSVTLGAPGNVTLTIPTLRLTSKTSGVLITVYRTQNNGTIFFQLNNLAGGSLQNSTTTDTVTYADNASDASIAPNPQLYTTGGVLQNAAPAPLNGVIVHRSRVFGIDPTTGGIWFTHQVATGSPLEFSAFLTLTPDPRGGTAKALASMDEKLIIFKTDRMFVVYGRGPDRIGGQNDFSDPILITGDTGCAQPKSIVLTPAGLMFKSPKGFYLLNRSMELSYIGAPVEAFNSASVTSAHVMPAVNQVRFTLNSGGNVLVYDYLLDQWSVFTNISATDATIWQSTYTYLTSAGIANKETAVFADPGNAFIPMKAVSPWIQLAQVQGFQRIYKMLVRGDFKSAHQLTVKLAYDLATSFTQTDNITVSADPVPYQFRIVCAKQKCQAIQISVEDVSTGTIGESLVLGDLLVEAGIKKGAFKVPASKSFG